MEIHPPPTYTTVAGGTYIDSSTNSGFIFYADNSVSQRTKQGVEITMEDCKWRIVEGYTVQIYDETLDDDVVFAFAANSDFTKLMGFLHLSGNFNRQ